MPPAAFAVVRLYRHGGWGGTGPGHLPDAGSVNDQSAWLMSAFAVIAEADAEYQQRKRGAEGGR